MCVLSVLTTHVVQQLKVFFSVCVVDYIITVDVDVGYLMLRVCVCVFKN